MKLFTRCAYPMHSTLVSSFFLSLFICFTSLTTLASDFKGYPECDPPKKVELIAENGARVLYWSGVEPSKTGVRYIVRYKTLTNQAWKEQFVYDDTRFELPTDATDDVELKTICDGKKRKYGLSSDWTRVGSVNNNQTRNPNPGDCSLFNGYLEQTTGDNGGICFTLPFIDSVDNIALSFIWTDCETGQIQTEVVFGWSVGQDYCFPLNTCSISVSLIWGYDPSTGGYDLACDTFELIEDPNIPSASACGDEVPPINPSGAVILSDLAIGDVVIVQGFTMTVLTESGSNGNFSGTGTLTIPFSDKVAFVDFTLQINSDYVAYGGTAAVKQDPNKLAMQTYLNNISAANAALPSKFCSEPIPIGPPRDGFDENGNYIKTPPYTGWVPGMPIDSTYDPNGFDANGNHRNGTEFNENGCSALGVTMEGDSCNPTATTPYYWLQNTESTESGRAFYDSVKDSLSILFDIWKTDFTAQLDDSLIQVAGTCQDYRQDIDDLIGLLPDVDPILIKGPGDKYVMVGMHEHFSSKPARMGTDYADRDQNAVSLENTHVDLYNCDKSFSDLEVLLDDLSEFEYATLEAQLLIQIQALSEIQTEELKVYPAFRIWYFNWLYVYLNQAVIGYEAPINNYIEKKGRRSEFSSVFNDYLNTGLAISPLIAQSILNNINATTDYLYAPIPLLNEEQGGMVEVFLDNVVINAVSGGSLDLYAIIKMPNDGQRLVLSATGLSFNAGGFDQKVSIGLGSDYTINISNTLRIVLKSGTEFNFDCGGFKDMHLAAEVEVCRSTLIPLDNNLDIIPTETEYVSGTFELDVSSFGDIYAEVTVDPFIVTGNNDIKWKISQIVVDLSDKRSASDVTFPLYYKNPHVHNQRPKPLWKGVYIGEITAVINGVQKGTDEVTVSAHHLVVDERGFSGSISYSQSTPLVTLGDGNFSGWACSINGLQIDIANNNVIGGGINGKLNIPLLKKCITTQPDPTEDDCFDYSISYTPDGITFEVKADDPLGYCIPLWKMEAEIKNINISGQPSEDGYKLDAVMDLKIKFDANDDVIPVKSDDYIELQGLTVRNYGKYFEVNRVLAQTSINLNAELAGFEFGLEKIQIVDDNGLPAIKFFARVGNVASDNTDSESTSEHISLLGGFKVRGEVIINEGRLKFKYHSLKIESFQIEAKMKKVYLYGALTFFEKTDHGGVWGDGFHAMVKVEVDFTGGKILAEGAAQFGKKLNNLSGENERYFFVDVYFETTGTGIPVGPLSIKGIGGGLSKNMSRDVDPTDMGSFVFNGPTTEVLIGKSLSGVSYTVDFSTSTTFSFKVGFGLAAEGVVTGNISYSMSFNAEGGIKKLVLSGAVTALDFMPIDIPVASVGNLDDVGDFSNEQPDIPQTFKGTFLMEWNFNKQNTFTANINFWLNAAPISGAYEGGYVGGANMHIGPDGWYFKIGGPPTRWQMIKGQSTDVIAQPGEPGPMALRVEVGGMAALELQMYFQIGNNLNYRLPDLPTEVTDIVGQLDRFMDVTGGKGLAFGAAIFLELNLNAGFIKSSVKAGVGFDLAIMDWGDCTCNGDPIGINGWYSVGQIWAYLTADLKVAGINIASVGVAGVLQIRLPNPTYIRGVVGVKVKILGKGIHKVVRVEVGEDCQIMNSDGVPLVEPDLITHVSPADQGELEFFSPINVVLKFPEGVKSEYTPLGSDDPISYKLVLKNQSELVTLASDGSVWPNAPIWDDERYSLNILPVAYWPDYGDSLRLKLELEVYKTVDGIEVLDRTEIVEYTFFIRLPINFIVDDNITASYPMDGQYNFYLDETENADPAAYSSRPLGGDVICDHNFTNGYGYIKLKYDQGYLFDDVDDSRVIIHPADGSPTFDVPYCYNYNHNTLVYELDRTKLKVDEIYRVQILREQEGVSDEGYNLYFRTSKFRKFKEKMYAIFGSDIGTETKDFDMSAFNNGWKLSIVGTATEPFGMTEYNYVNGGFESVSGSLDGQGMDQWLKAVVVDSTSTYSGGIGGGFKVHYYYLMDYLRDKGKELRELIEGYNGFSFHDQAMISHLDWVSNSCFTYSGEIRLNYFSPNAIYRILSRTGIGDLTQGGTSFTSTSSRTVRAVNPIVNIFNPNGAGLPDPAGLNVTPCQGVYKIYVDYTLPGFIADDNFTTSGLQIYGLMGAGARDCDACPSCPPCNVCPPTN